MTYTDEQLEKAASGKAIDEALDAVLKAYRQSDLDRLCTHQQRDERFHAKPNNPKRVQPE